MRDRRAAGTRSKKHNASPGLSFSEPGGLKLKNESGEAEGSRGKQREAEGRRKQREGSRPPGSENEMPGDALCFLAREPAARRSLTAYVSFEVQAFWPLSFFVLGKLVMQEGL